MLRADSSKISGPERRDILAKYDLADSSKIAVGTEAEVYSLDDQRLLKIYADKDRLDYLETLKLFYDQIRPERVDFDLPRIFAIESHGDLIAIIEKRIQGVTLESLWPQLDENQKHDAERMYIETAFQIKETSIGSTFPGYALFDQDGRSAVVGQRFEDFYAAQLTAKIDVVGRYFNFYAADFMDRANGLIAKIKGQDSPHLSLIHGDFFPGNLLVSEAATQVNGVIDFGSFTMFGDYLLDLAGAYGYFEMYAANRHQIRQRLLNLVLDKLKEAEKPRFFRYLLSNAILTSDLYATTVDPRQDGHFQWAVEIVTNQNYWEQT